MVIGVANAGGIIPPAWVAGLVEGAGGGARHHLGHARQAVGHPELKAAAERTGRRLIDVRTPPPGIPSARASGARVAHPDRRHRLRPGQEVRGPGHRPGAEGQGLDVDFRATGQTGIMIAGAGMPIDAVVSDFIAGAAEMLSPAADPSHIDVIEGQGSLMHPAYGAVSLGLLHGSQPDAFVVCHEPGRTEILGFPAIACRRSSGDRGDHRAGPRDQSEHPLRRDQPQHRQAVARRGPGRDRGRGRHALACRPPIPCAAGRSSSACWTPASHERSGHGSGRGVRLVQPLAAAGPGVQGRRHRRRLRHGPRDRRVLPARRSLGRPRRPDPGDR
jgi:hypothetical protein